MLSHHVLLSSPSYDFPYLRRYILEYNDEMNDCLMCVHDVYGLVSGSVVDNTHLKVMVNK